ncbi:MAG: FHA domain-containing protein [Synechococcaceae cyanobacterium SM2_3_1]|nr:FHA domain-containing protein [Synechococcaceae cyanobacterium SM2_3_1]
MHTPEYTQSLVPKFPAIGQNWLGLLLVHPLKGLSEEADVPGQAMVITDEYTTIGRSSSCQMMIKERFISRVHATIWREAATQGVVYWLHDGDLQESKPSSNGTLLKGERLQWPCQLADGAWIQLGNRIFLSFHEVRLPTPSEQQRHEVLADLLVEAGLISLAQLQITRAAMKDRACLLGEVLVQEKVSVFPDSGIYGSDRHDYPAFRSWKTPSWRIPESCWTGHGGTGERRPANAKTESHLFWVESGQRKDPE